MKKNISIIFTLIIILIGIIFVFTQKLEGEYKIPDDALISYTYTDSSGTHKLDKPLEKDLNYAVDDSKEICENADASWDYEKWSLKIKNITGKIKCKVEFKESLYGSVSLTTKIYFMPKVQSYEIDKEKAGLSDSDSAQSICPKCITNWKVINKKEDGSMEIIPESLVTDVNNNPIVIKGETGYKNYIGLLNEISKQFYNDKYTISEHTTPYYRHFGYNGQTEYLSAEEAGTSIRSSTFAGFTTPSLETSDLVGQEYYFGFGGDTMYKNDMSIIQNAYSKSDDNLPYYGTSFFIASRYKSNKSYALRIGYCYRTSQYLSYMNISDYSSDGIKANLLPIITLKPGITSFNIYYGNYVLD